MFHEIFHPPGFLNPRTYLAQTLLRRAAGFLSFLNLAWEMQNLPPRGPGDVGRSPSTCGDTRHHGQTGSLPTGQKGRADNTPTTKGVDQCRDTTERVRRGTERARAEGEAAAPNRHPSAIPNRTPVSAGDTGLGPTAEAIAFAVVEGVAVEASEGGPGASRIPPIPMTPTSPSSCREWRR